MKLNSGFENKKARIDMLPLIDIVFLLLVFFIYAMLSMVVHRGVKVELIASSSAQITKEREFITITVTSDKSIYINKKQVTIDDLVGNVLEQTKNKKDIPVFINGDQKTYFEDVFEILDRLKKAGISEVTFNTKKKE